jgi:predicted GTPase
MKTKRILILGAAGRDFHNFNVVFRGESEYNVVGFTATQIPGIANRRYPAELAGHLYPLGIPIFEEKDFEHLVDEHEVDAVVFSYSDISHQNLMHLASRVVATGADFWLLSSQRTQIKSSVPVVSILRGAHWVRQESNRPLRGFGTAAAGTEGGCSPPSHALRRSGRASRPALCRDGRPR